MLRVTIYRDPDAALAKAYDIHDGYKFHGQTVHFPALALLMLDVQPSVVALAALPETLIGCLRPSKTFAKVGQ